MAPFLSPYYAGGILLLAAFQSALPVRWRWWTLLAASIAACTMLSASAFWALAGTAVAATLLVKLTAGKKMWQTAGAALILAPLLLMKTAMLFVSGGISLLPGMSFYLLQASEYVRKGQAVRFSDLLLSLGFFPAFAAGPVNTTSELVPQFRSPESPDSDRADAAALRIAWGYFKKLVIADRIGQLLAPAFAAPSSVGGWETALVAVLSYVQIYADYSGYIDIALGNSDQ